MVDLSRYEHPMSPVRDDSALAQGEDLDREPDGIPHAAMAGIALATCVVAGLILLLLSGHVPKHPGALLAILVGVPGLYVAVRLIARNWRAEGAHASR